VNELLSVTNVYCYLLKCVS